MDCQTCTDHMLSNTAVQCFSKQPNGSWGDKTSLTQSALRSVSNCSGILCIYSKPLAHNLMLISHAGTHTCVPKRGSVLQTWATLPWQRMGGKPKNHGVRGWTGSDPLRHSMKGMAKPLRDIVPVLLGQTLTNINYFLTVADLCAIFYDSWKTWNSCKKQSVNLSKTRVDQPLYWNKKLQTWVINCMTCP